MSIPSQTLTEREAGALMMFIMMNHHLVMSIIDEYENYHVCHLFLPAPLQTLTEGGSDALMMFIMINHHLVMPIIDKYENYH